MPQDTYTMVTEGPATTQSPYAQDETERAPVHPIRTRRDVFRQRLRTGRNRKGTPHTDVWAALGYQRR